MNLQNGYKVLYEKAADGKRTFYASNTGLFANAEVIAEFAMGEYKLIYEKDGKIYGSTTGIPAEGDYYFKEFDKVFADAEGDVENDGGVAGNDDDIGGEDAPANGEVPDNRPGAGPSPENLDVESSEPETDGDDAEVLDGEEDIG